MKTKLPLSTLICALLLQLNAIAQTGPGGIGNSATNRIWLDASTVSQGNGTAISAWADKSGNGLTTTSDYPLTRPIFRTNQLNGFPSIDFDGTNDFLKINNATGINTQAISWFIVGNFNSLTASQTMLHFSHFGSSYNKNLRYTLYYSNNNRIFSSMLKTNGSGPISNHSLTTSTQVLSTLIGTTTVKSFTDGNQTGGFTAADLVSPVNSNAYVSIGRRGSINDMYLDGNVAEVIVFNYELTTPERVIVENYLSSKYNRAMSANDHYAYETGGYYYNVTGIGMEGGNSVTGSEGGSGITMSNVSALDDDDYLLWGHNNDAMTENFVDVPAEMLDVRGTRLDRVWRIDETNDVGTYTINVDMAGVTLGLDQNEYVILIDDDGDFTNGGTTIDSLENSYDAINDVAIFDNKDLPDGAYFTIGFMPKTIISIADGLWSNPATWNCNCVPSTATNVLIDETHEVTVDISAGCNNLDITATGSLIFTGGNELEILGDIESLGSLDGTDGIVNMAGTFDQDINVTTATFEDFIMSNTDEVIMVSGAVVINGSLTVTTGNFDLGTDLITLNSDATSTARIGISTGTFSGTMIIERFMADQLDGWANISSPLTNATFELWEDDFEMGFAEYIPDVSEPSAYGYSEALWDYIPVETNTTPLVAGVGYEAYLQTDTDENTTLGDVVADFSGTPNRGNITFAATATNDGYNLVGNPYASNIDWTTFRNNCGLSLGTDFLYYDESIDDYSTGTAGDILAQSQGFWIEALSAGTVTFRENNKSTSTSSAYRSEKEQFFTLRVSTNDVRMKSHTYFRFNDQGSWSYEQGMDQSYLKLPDPNAPALFTHSSEGKNLRINDLKAENEMVIPMSFIAGKDAEYELNMFNLEKVLELGYEIVLLEDKQTGVFYDLKAGNYAFHGQPNDPSDRFNLHLRKSESVTLTEEMSAVTFSQTSQGIQVESKGIDSQITIQFFNALGQEIGGSLIIDGANLVNHIQVPSIATGVYIVRAIAGDKVYSKQFYKN